MTIQPVNERKTREENEESSVVAPGLATVRGLEEPRLGLNGVKLAADGPAEGGVGEANVNQRVA